MLKKRLSPPLSILLTVVFFTGSLAAQQASQASTSKLLELSVPAPALKGNLLNDPTEQPTYVYLPPGYDASPTKRYPTLYLLHGFLSTGRNWTSGGYQGFSLQPVMDDLIKRGKVREMIVVAANGRNGYGGSFYTNSTVTGNWEDFIYRDLVEYIDATYRTLARAESRGIAGHSMGGYGAVMLGMKHPDVFGAVYALSPCCLVMEDDLSGANPAWSNVFGLKSRSELKATPESFDDFFNLVFVALSAAFSPNPQRQPFLSDFPFQRSQGPCSNGSSVCIEKNEPAYTKWRARFPVYVIDENKENLLKLHGIFLDYGAKEQFSHIRKGVKAFSDALAERNIPHEFEIYPDGDHGSRIRQRLETRVFEFFNEHLSF
jgi:S-formylglutathione hydrolase FrmB